MLLSTLVALIVGGTGPGLPPALHPDTACVIMLPNDVPRAGRKSPLDSLTFAVGKRSVKLCYSRPSSKGRTMIGGKAVPFDTIWRTGANEPTTVYAPIALEVAGVRVPAGSWTLYTVPGRTEWQVIVNRSTSQWGEESYYKGAVRAQEVGRGKLPSETLKEPIEIFTIRAEPAPDGGATLVLEWEHTRVRIPVRAGK